MAAQGGKRARENWDAGRVRALRRHMAMTQQQMADELGTRQQTISDWETGLYRPRGTSNRLLTFVAERAEFRYRTDREDTSTQEQGASEEQE